MDDRTLSYPDGYAARLIRYKARRLSQAPGFSTSDQRDLEQDLWVEVIDGLRAFDARKSSLPTFIDRIVQHGVVSILRHRFAAMRTPHREEFSLNEVVSGPGGFPVERHEMLPARAGPSVERQDLEHEVAAALATLSDEDRAVAIALALGTVNSAANEVDLPRSAVGRSIDNLSTVFEDAGLREYLG